MAPMQVMGGGIILEILFVVVASLEKNVHTLTPSLFIQNCFLYSFIHLATPVKCLNYFSFMSLVFNNFRTKFNTTNVSQMFFWN